MNAFGDFVGTTDTQEEGKEGNQGDNEEEGMETRSKQGRRTRRGQGNQMKHRVTNIGKVFCASGVKMRAGTGTIFISDYSRPNVDGPTSETQWAEASQSYAIDFSQLWLVGVSIRFC